MNITFTDNGSRLGLCCYKYRLTIGSYMILWSRIWSDSPHMRKGRLFHILHRSGQ